MRVTVNGTTYHIGTRRELSALIRSCSSSEEPRPSKGPIVPISRAEAQPSAAASSDGEGLYRGLR